MSGPGTRLVAPPERATDSRLEEVTRVLRELGGEAAFGEIRNRLLPPRGTAARAQEAHRLALAIYQNSDGRGSDRFETAGEGRYRLKESWLFPNPLSDER